MRNSGPETIRITGRDVAVLNDIRLSGVLGIEHVEELYFRGISRARRRMSRLESGGYVRRLFVATGPRAGRSAFAIGPPSADLLASMGLADRADVAKQARRPMQRMLVEHCLGVARTRVAILRDSGDAFSFVQEPLVRHEFDVVVSGEAERHVFRPDGLFRAEVGGTSGALFLEFDTSASSLGKIEQIAASYSRYLSLGLFAAEYGNAVPSVLFVTLGGPRRIRHVSAIAAKVPAPPFWFATLEGVEDRGAMGRIWVRRLGDTPVSMMEIAGGAGC